MSLSKKNRLRRHFLAPLQTIELLPNIIIQPPPLRKYLDPPLIYIGSCYRHICQNVSTEIFISALKMFLSTIHFTVKSTLQKSMIQNFWVGDFRPPLRNSEMTGLIQPSNFILLMPIVLIMHCLFNLGKWTVTSTKQMWFFKSNFKAIFLILFIKFTLRGLPKSFFKFINHFIWPVIKY